MGLQGGGGQDTEDTQKVIFAHRGTPSEVRAGGTGTILLPRSTQHTPRMAVPCGSLCMRAPQGSLSHLCQGRG